MQIYTQSLDVTLTRAADRASRSVARCLERKHVAGPRSDLSPPQAD